MEIIPAILTSDARELDRYLKILRDSKKYQRVQVDFIDGKYAKNLTIRPAEADLIPYLPLRYDAHLMVVEDNAMAWSRTAKAMGFEHVIMQVEKIKKPQQFSCLAFDLNTPFDPRLISKDTEMLLFMSVPAGFGGQEFDEKVFEKLKTASEWRNINNLQFEICIDGGIDQQHIRQLEELGADSVAVGVERVLSWM